ncbi:MAG: DUF2290 domain-containing protein [Candidatus Thiodiazotropha lotti]|nr:DUF2290 domain-containing protein [Candidatus Thiodiazotropha lotti]MCW4219792.1 DUF2290 domain-containing protein [Candidatus Thiodiazotropha lotti]
MPSPEALRQQLERLTADMIGLGLCNRQNFPSMRDLAEGCREVGFTQDGGLSLALKNVPYADIYTELDRRHSYNIRMLDGALLQMMYRFRGNQLESHRLAFFPSPFLEEYQNNPDIYQDDLIYAEVIEKNVVPFPVRFDYDAKPGVAVDVDHPVSHLTLGQYQNCRIPVTAPITPFHFISFVLRNFYNTAYKEFCASLSVFPDVFDASISENEKALIHISTPHSNTQAAQ